MSIDATPEIKNTLIQFQQIIKKGRVGVRSTGKMISFASSNATAAMKLRTSDVGAMCVHHGGRIPTTLKGSHIYQKLVDLVKHHALNELC